MRLLKYAIPALILVAAIGFLLRDRFSTQEKTAEDPAWIHAKASTTPAVLLSKMADEAVVEKTNPGGPGQFSARCIDYWTKMARISAKTYLETVRTSGTELSQACQDFETDIPFAAEMYRACTLTKEKKFQDEKNCLPWYKLYRAALIDKLTIGETDYSRLPDGILVSKFIGRMSAQGTPALADLRKMAAEIKHRQPENPSTYKILAALEILPERLDAKAGADAAEEGLHLNPNDEELQSAWFYFKSQDENFHYASFVEAHPEYPYGQFFRAAQLWESGQKETAVAMLANLQLKYPQNENFQQTMTFLQGNDGEGENPFNVHFDISKDDW